MKRVQFFLSVLCIIIMANSFGQTSDSVLTNQLETNVSLEQLMKIKVISASKIEQNQNEAPNVINVIPQQIIFEKGWLSLNDIMYSQPGFFPVQDYERKTVGFRGMFEGWNNNHYLMLIDGIPFNDNLYGTAYTWENMPLVFASSIELIRGSGGALYGTNAMNGVITINTLNKNDFNNTGKVRIRAGNRGTSIYDFALTNESEKLGMVLGFNRYQTNGNSYETYDASGRVDDNETPLKFDYLDARNSSYFFAKLYGKNKYEGLSFQFHEQRWSFETGHGWIFASPDFKENMKEYRRILTLRYAPRKERAFNYEIATKYQIHGIDWNMRYLPNDPTPGAYFPHGISEYLKTDAEDIWARVQGEYKFMNNIIVGGIETDVFMYNGDIEHYANYDMNTWADPTIENNIFSLNPWFEFVDGKNVTNIAGYVQYLSPKLLNKIQLTLSGRFDNMFFDYYDIYDDSKIKNKSFSQFTPRAAITFKANEKLHFKAIFGQAFRTPAPTEMFGVNTYTLASNIYELEPEIVTNIDFGANLNLNKNLQIKANGFWMNFENQIAYSVANYNLSTNIFSLINAGVELELLFVYNDFSAFFNYTYVTRLGEEITDTTILENKSTITWTPSSFMNGGITYNRKKLHGSLLFHYQGQVERRASDIYDGMTSYRPETLDAWLNIDLRAGYRVTKSLELGFTIKNLTNSEQYLIKNYQYLFDYKWEETTILVDLSFNF